MKRLFVLLFFLVFAISCTTINYNQVPNSIYQLIDRHAVTIAVNYYMPDHEFFKRLSEPFKKVLIKTDSFELSYKQEVIVIPTRPGRNAKTGEPIKCMSYIGSGTILRNNHIISVKHLFDQTENIYDMQIWVFRPGCTHAIRCEVVAISEGKNFFDDYAVIKTNESLGLPGLKIAEPYSMHWGEKVISTGSPGGLAFFHRVGFVTKLQSFLYRDSNKDIVLNDFNKFPFWVIYPGGPGDSGGSIKNMKGKIVSILYCGISRYDEEYIFSNPTFMLWDFLKENNLEWLAD